MLFVFARVVVMLTLPPAAPGATPTRRPPPFVVVYPPMASMVDTPPFGSTSSCAPPEAKATPPSDWEVLPELPPFTKSEPPLKLKLLEGFRRLAESPARARSRTSTPPSRLNGVTAPEATGLSRDQRPAPVLVSAEIVPRVPLKTPVPAPVRARPNPPEKPPDKVRVPASDAMVEAA